MDALAARGGLPPRLRSSSPYRLLRERRDADVSLLLLLLPPLLLLLLLLLLLMMTMMMTRAY